MSWSALQRQQVPIETPHEAGDSSAAARLPALCRRWAASVAPACPVSPRQGRAARPVVLSAATSTRSGSRVSPGGEVTAWQQQQQSFHLHDGCPRGLVSHWNVSIWPHGGLCFTSPHPEAAAQPALVWKLLVSEAGGTPKAPPRAAT